MAACLNRGQTGAHDEIRSNATRLAETAVSAHDEAGDVCGQCGREGFKNNPLLTRWRNLPRGEGAPVVAICAALESEIAVLSDEEKREFLADVGLTEPGLNRLIRAAYQLLGLQTYFTADRKKSAPGPFISAIPPRRRRASFMVTSKRALSARKSSAMTTISPAREKRAPRKKERCGWKGKEYVVQNGDVMHFRFNV